MTDAVVVPSTLALLPSYAGIEDPIEELRAACREAVSWLVGRHPAGVAIVHSEGLGADRGRGIVEPRGLRIGRALLAEVDSAESGTSQGVLVVANGTATRSEKAPGFLDDRAHDFDEQLVGALSNGDSAALLELDVTLAEQLWCYDLPAFQALAEILPHPTEPRTLYIGDPYGVQYWAGTWND